MYMNLSTFIGLKSPVLNMLNSLISQVLLSNKAFSYKKKCVINFNRVNDDKKIPWKGAYQSWGNNRKDTLLIPNERNKNNVT